MKKLAIVAFFGIAGWWFFIGGRTLSEEHIEDFYRLSEAATLKREPEILCSLLADEFQSAGVVLIAGQARSESQNKRQACDGYTDLYRGWEELGEKMGGILQLDSHYTLHSITIAKDKKSAEVDISSSLDVAGSIMNIKSRSTDTLIRRNGTVLLLRSKGVGLVSSGG
jgi:hypothetical protein